MCFSPLILIFDDIVYICVCTMMTTVDMWMESIFFKVIYNYVKAHTVFIHGRIIILSIQLYWKFTFKLIFPTLVPLSDVKTIDMQQKYTCESRYDKQFLNIGLIRLNIVLNKVTFQITPHTCKWLISKHQAHTRLPCYH